MSSVTSQVEIPAMVLRLAEKVQGKPISWKGHGDCWTIVFEDGRKLTFKRKDPASPVVTYSQETGGKILSSSLVMASPEKEPAPGTSSAWRQGATPLSARGKGVSKTRRKGGSQV